MPDVHLGKGSTIGCVIPTLGAIMPAAVGVDIGCGMIATRTSLTASDLPYNLYAWRSAIEKVVPHGLNLNRKGRDKGSWQNTPANVDLQWAELRPEFDIICAKHPILKNTNNHIHWGTLGTGNHFIEVCLDVCQDAWFMLHSGTRGIGNRIGTHFIELAKKDMEHFYINLPDKDLAYFPEGTGYGHFDGYVQAVGWAQEFARRNRAVMKESEVVHRTR